MLLNLQVYHQNMVLNYMSLSKHFFIIKNVYEYNNIYDSYVHNDFTRRKSAKIIQNNWKLYRKRMKMSKMNPFNLNPFNLTFNHPPRELVWFWNYLQNQT
jgi:hypothetical protein